MANAITKIASTTVGAGGAVSLQFTSIPGTYTDLLVLTSIRLTANDNGCAFTINNNSGSINNYIRFSAVGTAIDTYKRASSSFYDSLAGVVASSWTSNVFSNTSIYISNYTSSSNKNIFVDTTAENNASTDTKSITTVMIADTNPVTSVKIYFTGTSNDFAQYSSAVLYGVSKS